MLPNLKVVEIFQSIQGEGANFGMSCVFVRLAGCNMNCSFCDTDWKNGTCMSTNEVLKEVQKYNSNAIVWTGGEPTLQLTNDILEHFCEYYNCIETNGTNKVSKLIDYVAVSPKVSEKEISKNFDFIDEIRYAIAAGDKMPDLSLLPPANNYYLSPIFDGAIVNKKNLIHCLNAIMENPKWKLSVQMHKMLNVR